MHKIGLRLPLLLALASALAAPPVYGLSQPDGATIPAQPGCSGGKTTGLSAVFSCVCKEPNVCNQGAACPGGSTTCDDGKNGTCETTLWHEVNDNPCIPKNLSGLDPWTEAAVVPETFHPTCPQTFTLVTRGTALFQNAFGWYNVTGSKPKIEDLHVMLDCNAKPGDEVVLDLSKEPAYKGGDIGFFLVTPEKSDGQSGGTGTCDSLGCCATIAGAAQGKGFVYYSERKHNPDYAGQTSWIHLLTYESKIFSDTFYFAWEDSNKSPNNDFTDLVTSVSGIRCSGAGVACGTGQKGVCGAGVSICKQGSVSCEAVFSAGSESCNGLDDDCDGSVDEQVACADTTKVCLHGKCVAHCKSKEFPCPGGTVCDEGSGLCVEQSCVGAECDEGQICRNGACVAPCEGIVCPHGKTCVGDACVDPCEGVTCAAGESCSQGKCFPSCAQCNGLSCAAPLACDESSGQCADPSCAGGCPAGTFCQAGQCKDACEGAKCPSGQLCQNGTCCYASECGAAGAGGGLGLGGSASGGSSGSAGAGGTSDTPANDESSGCGCRATGAAGEAALLLFGFAFGALGRRKRRP